MAEAIGYSNNNSDSDTENSENTPPKKKVQIKKPGKAKRRSQKFREE